ncbi:Fe3+ hydroxamate ABC transporter substrate-binding protein [Planococcus plakortidis]|uniref:Fe3+ hydroxamate ABC transporter substrate-binding protein n=1 Tax=Planococcus plakortidis TaxID=1038856 RepID=A0A1C7EAK3_9BACL|nr:Fe3+ hydroxamate ABC transporter substrate-binding protein [Planococcus plakortidis]ANU20758.1 Fe3+ hydroxamate ABC transporter substrate-binding protein [Planococcus plakortidis]
MLNKAPECQVCGKEIEGDEVVHIQMRYPKRKGFAEVKAYLKLEGKFTCDVCAKSKT